MLAKVETKMLVSFLDTVAVRAVTTSLCCWHGVFTELIFYKQNIVIWMPFLFYMYITTFVISTGSTKHQAV